MRKLDIGIASYGNPEKLRRTIQSIRDMSRTDWRCVVIDNPSGDHGAVARVLQEFAEDTRVVVVPMDRNVGYAGAVNEIFRRSDTEYVAYCDNDIVINSPGWDEKLCNHLDMFHEIGLIFPNGGAYAIDRGQYHEVMWGVGFCWVMNRLASRDVRLPYRRGDEMFHGPMDEHLGHQEEADLCMRVRMAGWKCAALQTVSVAHDATATNDAAASERINTGVVNWVNKWCKYFGGVNLNYNSPNVLRWEDWPPNALYLEEYWKMRLPDLNKSPEVVTLDGREYDLIRVPRYRDFYRGRII